VYPRLIPCVIALIAVACSPGAADLPPTASTGGLSRIDIAVAAESLLIGDSVLAAARGTRSDGSSVSLAQLTWLTTDSTVGAVSGEGMIRARNVGSVVIGARSGDVTGERTVRVVPRALRVRLVAPALTPVFGEFQLSVDVETQAGVKLAAVSPRFGIADTSVASVVPSGIGRARVTANRTGTTELLAIIGADTTRRRFTVNAPTFNALAIAIDSRTVQVGDSVPFAIVVTDSVGRSISVTGAAVTIVPSGAVVLRNNYLVGVAPGRSVVRVTSGTRTALDTLVAQAPSDFALEIVDGDQTRPLPVRMLLSMDRVRERWQHVLRSAPPSEFVQLPARACRNGVPISNVIVGVRVLITLDTLPRNVAARGGPCVLRPGGLPIVGNISVNKFLVDTFTDEKLDDILSHELGHVLGLGSLWGRGALTSLVSGDSASIDPIFVGANALRAFDLLGESSSFRGRRIPLELGVLGHWRLSTFSGELMAPQLSSARQPLSAVTVGALRDLGWVVEPDAYEDFFLIPPVQTREVAPRIAGGAESRLVFTDDVLLPQLILTASGRAVPLSRR
jgi:hypothetical protein